MGEVIWLRERKPKTLQYGGPPVTPSEGQPMSKGEVIFTRICVVIILACADILHSCSYIHRYLSAHRERASPLNHRDISLDMAARPAVSVRERWRRAKVRKLR
jgi:hypothetical protein